jgi:hypothetical protein
MKRVACFKLGKGIDLGGSPVDFRDRLQDRVFAAGSSG